MPMQGFGQDHVTQSPQAGGLRNAGMELDMDWIGALRVNAPAVKGFPLHGEGLGPPRGVLKHSLKI